MPTSISVDSSSTRSVWRDRMPLLWISISCLGVGILIAILFRQGTPIQYTEHAYGMGFDIAAAGLGVWLTLIILGWWHFRGKLDLFEFPVWLSLNLYGQVVLNVWLLQRDDVVTIPWLANTFQTQMPLTVLLYGVGLTAMWAGYVIAFQWMKVPTQDRRNSTMVLRLGPTAAIWVVTWAIATLSALTAVQAYLGTASNDTLVWLNYLQFIIYISSVATSALAIHNFQHPSKIGWLWFLVMFSSGLVSSLIVGTKGFVFTIIAVLMYYYYAKSKFPKLWLAAGVLLVFAIVPVVYNYRQYLQQFNSGGGVDLAGRLEVLGNAIQDLQSSSIEGLVQGTATTFKTRQGSIFDVDASVVTLHPDTLPFDGGDMVGYVAQSLIPRLIWLDKPTERPALYLITSTYLAAYAEYSFSEIGLWADAYRAGGWLFVVVYFALIGIFMAWLYQKGPGKGSLPDTVFYIFIITGIITYSTEITTVVLHGVQFAIIMWGLIMFVMYKKVMPVK